MTSKDKVIEIIEKMFEDGNNYKTLAGPYGESDQYLLTLDGALWVSKEEAEEVAKLLNIKMPTKKDI